MNLEAINEKRLVAAGKARASPNLLRYSSPLTKFKKMLDFRQDYLFTTKKKLALPNIQKNESTAEIVFSKGEEVPFDSEIDRMSLDSKNNKIKKRGP